MGAPISSLSILALKVGQLAYEEVIYLDAVGEKLNRLREELIWMKCFLKDAAARRSREEIVNIWVAQVRDNAYEAEDIIDTFDIKIASSKRRCGCYSNCNILKHAPLLHGMGKKIDKLTEKFSDLNRRAQVYGIKPLQGREVSTSCREIFPSEIEKDIVGFDGYIRTLVSILQNKEGQKYAVITVSGMGGLGKTTLAKNVYQDNEIRGYFNCFAWAYISQQYQTRDVLQNILLQIESPDQTRRKEIINLTPSELAQQLREMLLEKKCLVILDDLWRIQDWDSMKDAFPRGEPNSNSKILITTRNEGVAEDERNRFLLKPGCLDEGKAWELLRKIVFPTSIHDNAEISKKEELAQTKEELAQNMVKHCGGLPLAIRVLGGLLSTKDTLHEWEIVNEQIVQQIARGGSGGQEDKGVRNILASSYDDLPAHLKSCFLYMAQFPEDHEINVDRLVEMWMAEGLVEPVAVHWEEEQEELEDVAESYLRELIGRSMVLPGEGEEVYYDGYRNLKWRGTYKTCRLHDLMRDLCLSKAKEENMLQILNQKVKDEESGIYSESLTGKVWRLAMHDEVKLKHLSPNPHLRSLWLFCDIFSEEELESHDKCFSELALTWKIYRNSQHFWLFVSKEYKLLRVLNLEGVALRRSPHEIGELIYLKMLVFGDVARGVKLPSSLGKLRRLQTLYFLDQDWSSYHHIPDVLWKLVQLRHLYLPFFFPYKYRIRIGKWRNLRKLINFPLTDKDTAERLGEMTQLRVLRVTTRELTQGLVEALSGALVNLRLLRSLSIIPYQGTRSVDVSPILIALQGCPHFCKLELAIPLISPLISLPADCQMFPSTIIHLVLWASELFQDPMPTLEQLPNLQSLCIGYNSFMGEEMVCSKEGFPKLDSFILRNLRNFKRLIIHEGAMRSLRRMTIVACFSWENAPDALRAIKTIEELDVKEMPQSFNDRLVLGGADHEKVKDIPFLRIGHCAY